MEFSIILMTEVFIAAVSTTRFEMNEEDLQFYRDEKAREIQEVRVAMEQLHGFEQLPKKERPMANHALLWRNLLILAKILGFEAEFALIDQLRIPDHILTQPLWIADLFALRHYYPRTPVGSWEAADSYFVLLEGIVEKEQLRVSISRCDDLDLGKINSGSKFRKNNKKRFARTDEQIPICLNSRRSENRSSEPATTHFRAVTDVEMLEVNCSVWKRYVGDFKHLQEEYLMNFIRKKLNLSLNFDAKDSDAEPDPPAPFYEVATIERKAQLHCYHSHLILLYMGEMLLTTPHYKLEISRGCLLNPVAADLLTLSSSPSLHAHATAVAKSLATVIKISVSRLQEYFKEAREEREAFIELLGGLESNRRSKKDEEKGVMMPRAESLASLGQSSVIPKLSRQVSQDAFKTISQSPTKLQKPIESTLRLRQREKVGGLKAIENMVEKTAKAAELKHIEYLKRAHLTEDHHQQENSLLPEYIFKDCMKNIEAKNEILKQAVRAQRDKLRNDLGTRHNALTLPECPLPATRPRPMRSPDTAAFLKKRIKDIYVKTEGCEELISLATSSQRPTAHRPITTGEKGASRETVGGKAVEECGLWKWYAGSLGVMKKVQTGKIRRIKLK